VIVARWNRAILTPSGIARRLFGLDRGTPVEVRVPVDHYGPYQIKHGGIVVIPADDRLIVQPDAATFAELERAKLVAARSINSLPETPFTAAGINIRYRATASVGALLEITSQTTDSRLSDAGLSIAARSLRRAVEWKGGRINIDVESQPDSFFTIQLNFDRTSEDKDAIRSWLEVPIDEIQCITNNIMERYIGASQEDYCDDETD